MSNPTDLRRAKAVEAGAKVIASWHTEQNPMKGMSFKTTDDMFKYMSRTVLLAAIRASDEAAGMVLVPREQTNEQILAAWYKALQHPEQEMLRLRDTSAREMHIEELRTFLYMLAVHGGEDG